MHLVFSHIIFSETDRVDFFLNDKEQKETKGNLRICRYIYLLCVCAFTSKVVTDLFLAFIVAQI